MIDDYDSIKKWNVYKKKIVLIKWDRMLIKHPSSNLVINICDNACTLDRFNLTIIPVNSNYI